jgi:hypothetical protein
MMLVQVLGIGTAEQDRMVSYQLSQFLLSIFNPYRCRHRCFIDVDVDVDQSGAGLALRTSSNVVNGALYNGFSMTE